MARPLRIEFPGALYHVTARGNEKRPIFRSDRDRKVFLEFLGQAVHRFGWSLTAWVLMTNHFHLVVKTPEPNLSRGMQWLNGKYAGWFNARHDRTGHLFQSRFKAHLIEEERYFAEVQRYVVLNPVRARLATHPEDYRWSSYRATAGLDIPPAWLDVDAAVADFGGERHVAQVRYQEFVLVKIGCTDVLWANVINGIYLGGDEWAKRMRTVVESKPRSTDHPKIQRAIGRPKMHAIIGAIARVAGRTASAIRTMRGGDLRRLAAWIGWHEGLVTLRTIAASLRLRSEGHVSDMIRRCERSFASNYVLLTHLDGALAALR